MSVIEIYRQPTNFGTIQSESHGHESHLLLNNPLAHMAALAQRGSPLSAVLIHPEVGGALVNATPFHSGFLGQPFMISNWNVETGRGS